jgi:hypothetical protein
MPATVIPKTVGKQLPRVVKPKAPKAKQTPLPTMEDMHDPEIVKAAEVYVELRDERMDILKQESEAKKVLLDAMVSKNRKTYKLDSGEVVEVTEEKKLNVTVRKATPAKKDGDE